MGLKLIRIGGRDWEVRFRRDYANGGADGTCHYGKARLDIRKGQSKVDETDTIIHELFHAILYCQGRENGGKVEETYVRALATGFTALLQDNPEFASWLLTRNQQ